MIRFNLGPIPVEVHYSHLLVSAALAIPSFQARAGPPAISVAFVLMVMAVISVSVLVHEMGHALVSLAFGYQPDIQLLWMGGLTRPNARGPIAWHRDVLLTVAGPTFGLILGVACYWINGLLRPTGMFAQEILGVAIWVNLGWSLVNLLPVLPLDGGRIASALLTRLFGRRGFLLAQLLTLGVSSAIVLVAYKELSNSYLIFMFGLFAVRSIAQISAYFRGENPPGLKHPAERALAEAEAAYAKSQLDVARRQAEAALQDSELPPSLRSRAHHLLGWIDIKEGQGRAALDQFAQVSSRRVEPQALAAAFALIGDEERAAPLWELAYRDSGDRTILHEWAGTLIRGGRTEDAKKLPGVDLAIAFMCAMRVFSIRGHHSDAARIGLQALAICPQPQIAYDTACALARAGDQEGALRTLVKASALGFTDAEFAESDADLASLHAHAGFHAWLRQLRETKAS
jgi:Zn-dependent protease